MTVSRMQLPLALRTVAAVASSATLGWLCTLGLIVTVAFLTDSESFCFQLEDQNSFHARCRPPDCYGDGPQPRSRMLTVIFLTNAIFNTGSALLIFVCFAQLATTGLINLWNSKVSKKSANADTKNWLKKRIIRVLVWAICWLLLTGLSRHFMMSDRFHYEFSHTYQWYILKETCSIDNERK